VFFFNEDRFLMINPCLGLRTALLSLEAPPPPLSQFSLEKSFGLSLMSGFTSDILSPAVYDGLETLNVPYEGALYY
jgi:hypothetical protein